MAQSHQLTEASLFQTLSRQLYACTARRRGWTLNEVETIKKFAAAAATLLASTALAQVEDFDRSGQSISPLFEEGGESGGHAQLSFGIVTPSANGNAGLGNPLNSYSPMAFAYKNDFSEQLSFALIGDQPFGADVQYGATLFNARNTTSSSALTGVLRYKLGDGVSLHGGLRALRLSDATSLTGHSQYMSSDWRYGYVVGAAYEIPEIALRVALTYNSKIVADMSGTRNGAAVAFKLTLPESVNLEFQSGIAADTVLTASVRHIGWSGFTVEGLTHPRCRGCPHDSYSLGLGHRLSENFSASATLNFKAPGDVPRWTIVAANGQTTLTLGGQYALDNMTISGGITVGRLGDQSMNGRWYSFSGSTIVGTSLRIGFDF